MNIKFKHWKDRQSHRGAGVTLYRNVRKYWFWAGKHCFCVEVHGLGPNP